MSGSCKWIWLATFVALFAATSAASAQSSGAVEPAQTSVTAACAAGEALERAGLPTEALTEYVSVIKERPVSQCARRGIERINAATANTEPCAAADALAAAGQTADATAAYVEVLKSDPHQSCASVGLAALNHHANPCAAADALHAAGQDTSARDLYVEVLKQDPAQQCAVTGLAALPLSQSCAVGDALKGAGLDDEANQAYIDALKANPTARCASDALQKDTRESVQDSFDSTIAWVLTILSWLALGLGAAVIALLILTRWPLWVRRLLVRAKWIDRLVAPRLALGSFENGGADPDVSNGVEAAVRRELISSSNPSAPGIPYQLDRLTGREGLDDALEKVEALAAPLGALGAVTRLVLLLIPRARFSASGTLQARATRGAGVTLGLEGAPEAASTMLWSGHETDPDKDDAAERYQSLAVPAAAWIDFEVLDALGGPLPSATRDSRSYALLQGGIGCERTHDDEGAERYYRAALEADPWNYAAMLNLSNLQGRRANNPAAAVRGLTLTLTMLRCSP